MLSGGSLMRAKSLLSSTFLSKMDIELHLYSLTTCENTEKEEKRKSTVMDYSKSATLDYWDAFFLKSIHLSNDLSG